MIKCDGFDDAIIGIANSFGVYRVVYDKEKMIKICKDVDNMKHDEAVEFLEFNTWNAHVGANTPIYVDKMSITEIEERDRELIKLQLVPALGGSARGCYLQSKVGIIYKT